MCSLKIPDNKISYDVKVYITGDNGVINRIWDGNKYQRSDWYAPKLLIDDETEVKIFIHKEFSGEAKGELKLRRSGEAQIEYVEEFNIEIGPEINSVLDTKEGDKNEKEDIDNKISKKEKQNEEVEKVLKSQNEPEEIKEIILIPKTIKAQENTFILDKNNLSWAGLVMFCIVLGGLFFIQKKTNKENKNEFRKNTIYDDY